MSPSPVPLTAKKWHSLHLSMGQEENTVAYAALRGKSIEDPPEFPSLAENKLYGDKEKTITAFLRFRAAGASRSGLEEQLGKRQCGLSKSTSVLSNGQSSASVISFLF